MRELQHLHDLSQEQKSPGVPLLWICGSNAKELPEVRFQICLFFGEGSEHLEERLRKEFPTARISRLDRDTTRTASGNIRRR